MNYEKPLIFAAGLVIGAGGMYFGIKGYFERLADEEIASVKMAYKVANKAEDAKNEASIKKDTNRSNSRVNGPSEPLYEQKLGHFGYNSISASIPEELEEIAAAAEEEPEDILAMKESPKDDGKRAPYIIDSEEFALNAPYYNQVTVTYYPVEGMLVDDISGEFEDVESSIGRANANLLAESDEDVTYIRNDNLGIDYEVVKSNAAYNPEVNGYRIY